MTVKTIRVEPSDIGKKVGGKGAAPGTGNFDAFMGAVDAMAPLNTELMYQATGSSNAAAVLHGAFSGMSGVAGSYGVGTGGAAGASFGGYGGYGALSEYPAMMGVASYGTTAGAVGKGFGPGDVNYKAAGPGNTTPGTDMPTGDLMNTMNMNNLKLLELQATMQSNMQAWNTKSNILSADHRARMSMIEKFAARG